MAASVRARTSDAAGPASSSIPSMRVSVESQSKMIDWKPVLPLSPVILPLRVEDWLDAARDQHLDASGVAVGRSVEHVGDAALNDQLGAHGARAGRDEHDLIRRRSGCFDERIGLGICLLYTSDAA